MFMGFYAMVKKIISSDWYGELRSTRGNTIVIRDSKLSPPAQGRIYLYNTERQAIVQYDEKIVSDKLFELDSEQKKQAKKQFYAGWKAAKIQLLKGNGKLAVEPKKAGTFDPIDYFSEQNENEDSFDQY
ncbi:MAG: hypothetical protein HN475_04250 [Piscirickettsiaceae bacterium]|jgi:hypothetical protein|nr:hypothetical protein [Piscirickettsiaceae bacterium]